MTEEKFTAQYFDIHYHIKDNTVYRNEDSSGECQGLKEKCLRCCFTHFIGEDLTGAKSIGQHFKTNGKIRRDILTRCCCSQLEEEGIMHGIVTHKSTNISFIVGKDCFSKMFSEADDVVTFWKEECKYCKQIVKSRSTKREYFCNKECVKAYEEEQAKKEEELKKQTQLHTAILNEAFLKAHGRWGNGLEKIYTKCELCRKPKHSARDQEFKFCFRCNKKNKAEASQQHYY